MDEKSTMSTFVQKALHLRSLRMPEAERDFRIPMPFSGLHGRFAPPATTAGPRNMGRNLVLDREG